MRPFILLPSRNQEPCCTAFQSLCLISHETLLKPSPGFERQRPTSCISLRIESLHSPKLKTSRSLAVRYSITRCQIPISCYRSPRRFPWTPQRHAALNLPQTMLLDRYTECLSPCPNMAFRLPTFWHEISDSVLIPAVHCARRFKRGIARIERRADATISIPCPELSTTWFASIGSGVYARKGTSVSSCMSIICTSAYLVFRICTMRFYPLQQLLGALSALKLGHSMADT